MSKSSVFDNDKNFDGVGIHDPTDDDCLDDDMVILLEFKKC